HGIPQVPPAAGPVAQTLIDYTAPSEGRKDVQNAVRPMLSKPLDRVGHDRDCEPMLRHDDCAADEALKRAAMTEPVEFGAPAAHDAEAVMPLDRRVSIAPLRPGHFTPARNRQHTSFRIGI